MIIHGVVSGEEDPTWFWREVVVAGERERWDGVRFLLFGMVLGKGSRQSAWSQEWWGTAWEHSAAS